MSKLTSRPDTYTLPRWEAIWTPEYVLDRMAELRWQSYPMNYLWARRHETKLTF